MKEDRKTITEIISLAFFQNENFSNTSAKWYQQFNVRSKSKQISIFTLIADNFVKEVWRKVD